MDRTAAPCATHAHVHADGHAHPRGDADNRADTVAGSRPSVPPPASVTATAKPTTPTTRASRPGWFAVFDKSARALAALRAGVAGQPLAMATVEAWIASAPAYLMLVDVAPVRMICPAFDRAGIAAGLERLAAEIAASGRPPAAVAFTASLADDDLREHCLAAWMATQAGPRRAASFSTTCATQRAARH